MTAEWIFRNKSIDPFCIWTQGQKVNQILCHSCRNRTFTDTRALKWTRHKSGMKWKEVIYSASGELLISLVYKLHHCSMVAMATIPATRLTLWRYQPACLKRRVVGGDFQCHSRNWRLRLAKNTCCARLALYPCHSLTSQAILIKQ